VMGKVTFHPVASALNECLRDANHVETQTTSIDCAIERGGDGPTHRPY
jgi:hypothetical protein